MVFGFFFGFFSPISLFASSEENNNAVDDDDDVCTPQPQSSTQTSNEKAQDCDQSQQKPEDEKVALLRESMNWQANALPVSICM